MKKKARYAHLTLVKSETAKAPSINLWAGPILFLTAMVLIYSAGLIYFPEMWSKK